jgi:hypoxanthine phosphoribosyltransferase
MQARKETMRANMQCELISWERFYTLARQLALAVEAAGFQPEVIVAIGRGGYMPARIYANDLDYRREWRAFPVLRAL